MQLARPIKRPTRPLTRSSLYLIALLAIILLMSVARAEDQRISVMTYNVENLFDTVHDEDRVDFTYMPKSEKQTDEVRRYCKSLSGFYRQECFNLDWNENVLDAKLNNLVDAITQVHQGFGPDILFVEEVENDNVLRLLNNKMPVRYETQVLIEGPDERGIDPGVLSRFPQWKDAELHIIPFEGGNGLEQMSRTRGILQVNLTLPDGTLASVFALHFPSQSHDSMYREQAIQFLAQLMESVEPGVVAIAGGDFNVIAEEDQQNQYFKNILSPIAYVSQLVGSFEREGTHYFKKDNTWSFFDVLAVSRASEQSGWTLDAKSLRISDTGAQQLTGDETPMRFDPQNETGSSDHWPMYGELVKK